MTKCKVSNASMGSMLSNKFAVINRSSYCVKKRTRFSYSDRTVTNNNSSSRDNKVLSTIYKDSKNDCDITINPCDNAAISSFFIGDAADTAIGLLASVAATAAQNEG